jgi:hypothetical protein
VSDTQRVTEREGESDTYTEQFRQLCRHRHIYGGWGGTTTMRNRNARCTWIKARGEIGHNGVLGVMHYGSAFVVCHKMSERAAF